ncbi:hypothetical protein GGH95_005508 [Coemansia sp. RSA 1836]|nr:hypothetical protein GGH95_005508 [Coemansia sp. RSA 1836]
MEQAEEQEWMLQQNRLQRRVSRALSLSSSNDGETDGSQPQATRLRHSHRLSLADLSGIDSIDIGSALEKNDVSSPDRSSLLMSRGKDLSDKIQRRKSHASVLADNGTSVVRGAPPISRRHSIAVQLTGVDASRDHLPTTISPGLTSMGGSGHSSSTQEASAQARQPAGLVSSSGADLRARQSIESLLESIDTGGLELTREMNELAALRNKDARATKDGVDLSSLYAFRCIHGGKYGTLFVTPEKLVFRRSRIMGGRRSSVSSYQLSSVVAIRKAAGHFRKSHGVQMLLRDGGSLSFYGLSSRDDVFGFLLVRCGNSHVY